MPIQPQTAHTNFSPGQEADTLCQLVHALAVELDPGRKDFLTVTLDSSLDLDLGFDSLSKMELLSRLERTYAVMLPDQVLTSAETVRDLLRAVLRATKPGHSPAEAVAVSLPEVGEGGGVAEGSRTLVEVLEWQLRAGGDRPHILLYAEGEQPEEISYRTLYAGALEVGRGLQRYGIEAGQSVAIMLPTGRDYLYSFFGVLLAGAVPVPLYPPMRPAQLEEHLGRHRSILNNAQARLLITIPEARPLARLLKTQVDGLHRVATVAELGGPGGSFTPPPRDPQDTAFLQYTSGSTGTPKGVILSHANLLANIRAMGKAVQAGPKDVFVSWLPLYHDMGLIGAWLGSLYHGCRFVLLSPLSFLLRPARWLWAIHNHKGTLSASPNFGYELCLNKIREEDIAGLDLSSWRLAFNGAEPVSPETVLRFAERFGRYGLREEAMAPVYGLAEASVGLAFPPLGRAPLIDRVQRQAFMRSGEAVPAEPEDSTALRFVTCGQPLEGHQIRIVDPSERELPERQEGRLQFRGPSVTSGYFRNPGQTADLFHSEWLDSGDMAYQAAREIYITSRVKDIIIRGGRNISPYELEEAVGEIAGIRKGCVAVFGVNDPVSATEKLVILAESREREPDALARLREEINGVSLDLLGSPPDEVMLVPPHTVLKTSSGKIRRAASREMYEAKGIGRPQRAVWWQLLRLFFSGLLPQLRRGKRLLFSTLYAGYCWGIYVLLSLPAWLLVALLPSRRFRWLVARSEARFLVRASGTPLKVTGLENLQGERPMILVSNHQSYLDSIVLVSALPREFRFVAKTELAERFGLGLILSRLNVEFVERFDSRQAASDARRLGEVAAGGHSLFFFSEGTFQRLPGLLPFRMGAFVAAAESGMPVVPIAIRGTRSKLRSGTWFPRRGPVAITIGKPFKPQGRDWSAALALRNEIRRVILHNCGEPDLASLHHPEAGNHQPEEKGPCRT